MQTKRYWVPSLGRMVKLQVSPRGNQDPIDKLGIDRVCQDILARGEKI